MKYIIIGAGPGGYELAAMLSRQSHDVTLVERDRLGGTCLNRGCIPTKVMAHAASLARSAAAASDYGIGLTVTGIDFSALRKRRDVIVDTLRQNVGMLLSGVNVVIGDARFVAPRTVEVNGESMTADRIVIATGSSAASLPVPGAYEAVSSDGLLSLEAVPDSLAIIGGGVIGLEFASIFSALGSRVTVIEYFKEVLPQFDKDVAKRLRMSMTAAGVTFVTGAEVTAIEPGAVRYRAGTKEGVVEASVTAMAVGRRPNLPGGLEVAGVETDRGAITVDPRTMRTSAPGIYAIGDVNGICMLAHAASAQARIVAGEDVVASVVPSVVFTSPEASMVGMTEQQCKEAGIACRTAKVPFRGNGKAVTIGETDGMVKLIAEAETGNILGCQIVGPHAADLIEEVAVAMANGLTAAALTRTIHPHPTLCEAIQAAAMMLK
ncbi:MAG: dihydrolipoyl dehydrogenase [Muribaculaceae bacterium]|nr:dihydrolipoyl dehydrogenase [Muribaculaceae bacterium]